MAEAAGYSGTPLARKLGIGEGMTVARVDPPAGLGDLLAPLPPDVTFREGLRGRPDVVLMFVIRRAELRRRLGPAGRAIFPAGALWVCWPKKSAGVVTDMSEDVVRALALPGGWSTTRCVRSMRHGRASGSSGAVSTATGRLRRFCRRAPGSPRD